MALRTYVAYLEKNISGELSLDRQVVLRRILRTQYSGELTEKQDGSESFPVDRCSARRIHNTVEWIRPNRSVLIEERGLECRVRNKVAAPEWRFRAELFEHELFDGV